MAVINMITTFLGNNKKYLNYDGYIQFDKSVRNPDVSAPYQWIDGLQLDKYSGEVYVWLSTEKSEHIHSIPLKNIERNEELLGDILKHLIETITKFNIIGVCNNRNKKGE